MKKIIIATLSFFLLVCGWFLLNHRAQPQEAAMKVAKLVIKKIRNNLLFNEMIHQTGHICNFVLYVTIK